jgi:hypothetical protein
MTVLYELRNHQRRHGRVKLVTRQEAESMTGFISVFGFPEETADLIKLQSGTYGLGGMPLYVDRVILDFDDEPEAYQESIAYCCDKDWNFDAYATGNRGHHIHVYVVPYSEVGVHVRAANWAKAHFKGHDDTMFKCSGVTRIPGTHHSKTGRKMKLVDGRGLGHKPDIRDAKIPMPVITVVTDEDTNEDRGLIFTMMLNKHIHKGGRNEYAFKLAACGFDAGVAIDDLQDMVESWAMTHAHPMVSAAEIKIIVRSAYRGRRFG